MRLILLFSLMLPSLAMAQGASTNSMMQNFPEAAITRVGEESGIGHYDNPANPPSPATPANAPTAVTPASPSNPTSPTPPEAPSKLWPRDTVQIFMPACIGFKPALAKPCTCVITRLMVAMPHDEFLKKSQDGTIEQDPTLNKIRTDCATAPQQKS